MRYHPILTLREVRARGEELKTYEAQGRVLYKGEGGSGSFDFRCYISADSLRLLILTPFGLPLADLLLRPDTLYLLDYGSSTLFLDDPSSPLGEVWGLKLTPAQILDLFKMRLPEGEPSQTIRDGADLLLRYGEASYRFSAKTQQLLSYEAPGLVVQFRDYDPLLLRPRQIHLHTGGEEIQIRIKDQTLSPKIAPERFTIDLPPGVTVYDLMGE